MVRFLPDERAGARAHHEVARPCRPEVTPHARRNTDVGLSAEYSSTSIGVYLVPTVTVRITTYLALYPGIAAPNSGGTRGGAETTPEPARVDVGASIGASTAESARGTRESASDRAPLHEICDPRGSQGSTSMYHDGVIQSPRSPFVPSDVPRRFLDISSGISERDSGCHPITTPHSGYFEEGILPTMLASRYLRCRCPNPITRHDRAPPCAHSCDGTHVSRPERHVDMEPELRLPTLEHRAPAVLGHAPTALSAVSGSLCGAPSVCSRRAMFG